MRYRIIEINKLFYPQRKVFIFWVCFTDGEGLRGVSHFVDDRGLGTICLDGAKEMIRQFVERETLIIHSVDP